MQAESSIRIDESGDVIIQDKQGHTIIIHLSDGEGNINTLQRLSNLQIDGLLQVAEKFNRQFPNQFETLLNNVAREKNIVRGSISNVKSVRIGDEIHYHYHAASLKLPRELSLNMPRVQSADIIGRSQELDLMHQSLFAGHQSILLNGLGGIGKTTLAQVYTSKYYNDYHHIVWVSQNAQNSILHDFINTKGLIKNLDVEVAGLEPEMIFEEIIRKLKGVEDRPNLLVIDNAEQTIKKYADMLPGQPGWHLVLTSSEELSGFYVLPVGFLSESEAIELFKKHYTHKKIDDEHIRKLVVSVDYHTLTIEILAKTAQVLRYTIDTLQETIAKNLNANVEGAHNKLGTAKEKIITYLSLYLM